MNIRWWYYQTSAQITNRNSIQEILSSRESNKLIHIWYEFIRCLDKETISPPMYVANINEKYNKSIKIKFSKQYFLIDSLKWWLNFNLCLLVIWRPTWQLFCTFFLHIYSLNSFDAHLYTHVFTKCNIDVCL